MKSDINPNKEGLAQGDFNAIGGGKTGTKSISFRVSEIEYQEIQSRAAHGGMNLSQFMRHMCLDKPPPRKARSSRSDLKVLKMLIGRLQLFGDELRILAHEARQGGWPETEEIITVLRGHEQMRAALMDALGVGNKKPKKPFRKRRGKKGLYKPKAW